MNINGFVCSILIACLPGFGMATASAQGLPDNVKINPDTILTPSAEDYSKQRDLIDIAFFLLHKKPASRVSSVKQNRNIYISAAPIVEYTIATGFSPGIAGNIAFKNSVEEYTNTSSLLGAIKYTQKKQFLLPIQTSFWTPGNRYNFLGDWRYFNYSQDIYGLGGHTTLADKYVVTYKYLRLYEFALKKIAPNLYAGPGYKLDYHWNITEPHVQAAVMSDFKKYGFSPASVSSGLSFTFLYDSRENSINPQGGSFFTRLEVLQNFKLLGSTSNWNSLLLDIRKYVKMPHHTVLAFWSYSLFTLSGKPPYLDLPATGADFYNNSGRGYEQSRFSGKSMLYLESEYRFGITRDGLLGGVLFGNAQSFREMTTGRFEVLLPGFGAGLRIKFNKFSGTNVAVDYGVGTKGSKGFVGNLGEVF